MAKLKSTTIDGTIGGSVLATDAEATAGTSHSKIMTPKLVKKAIETIPATQLICKDYGTPIEIGTYIDFHYLGSSKDYDGRAYIGTDGHLHYVSEKAGDITISLPQQASKGGKANFKGNSGYTRIAHGLGKAPAAVSITPTANPSGNLGEYWCTSDATNIDVYNSGSATTQFAWIVM